MDDIIFTQNLVMRNEHRASSMWTATELDVNCGDTEESGTDRVARRETRQIMTTYKILQERGGKIIQRLVDFSGLPKPLLANIVMYVRMLVRPGTEDIDELIFCAQLSKRFNVTSAYILSLIFYSHKNSKSNIMSLEQFCKCICIFLSKNVDMRVEFLFKCYDVDGDNYITRPELYALLRPCITLTETEDQDMDESVKELIDIVFHVMDLDKNEKIDLGEFQTVVRKDSLYLDFLGHVLPSREDTDKFLHLFKHKTPLEVKRVFAHERSFLLCELPTVEETGLYPIVLDMP